MLVQIEKHHFHEDAESDSASAHRLTNWTAEPDHPRETHLRMRAAEKIQALYWGRVARKHAYALMLEANPKAASKSLLSHSHALGIVYRLLRATFAK